jgi:hypothetical protein
MRRAPGFSSSGELGTAPPSPLKLAIVFRGSAPAPKLAIVSRGLTGRPALAPVPREDIGVSPAPVSDSMSKLGTRRCRTRRKRTSAMAPATAARETVTPTMSPTLAACDIPPLRDRSDCGAEGGGAELQMKNRSAEVHTHDSPRTYLLTGAWVGNGDGESAAGSIEVALDGSAEDGSTEDGSTEKELIEEELMEEGSMEEGSMEEGSMEEGSMEEGSMEEMEVEGLAVEDEETELNAPVTRTEYAEMAGVAEACRWLRDELPWRKRVLDRRLAQNFWIKRSAYEDPDITRVSVRVRDTTDSNDPELGVCKGRQNPKGWI